MTTTAQTFDPAFDLDRVEIHPHNVRRNAIADDDMVESVRAGGLMQPLVTVPHPQDPTKVRLVMGHRRLDALRKAGATTAPVITRTDLPDEASQVASMLVENGDREDLSPIEEAEGYDLLREVGWKAPRIAKETGRSAKTVTSRLKLLKLQDKAKAAVHDGQITLEDALAIADLDAKDQGAVQRAAGTPQFRYSLEEARTRKQRRAAAAKQIKELEAAGVPQATMPPGAHSEYSLTDADHGMTRLGSTISSKPEDHPGCLAFIPRESRFYGTEVLLVCTDASAHDEQVDQAQRERAAERDRLEAEVAARQQAETITRTLRTTAVLDLVKPGIKLDTGLRDILRALLPSLLRTLEHPAVEYYQELVGIDEDARWSGYAYQRNVESRTRFLEHVDALDTGSDRALARALCALLLAGTESRDLPSASWHSDSWSSLRHHGGIRYLALAQQSGHELTEVDEQLLAIARDDEQAES